MAEAIPVELQKTEQGWQLLRDGEPYLIRGAGGTHSLQLLAAAGGVHRLPRQIGVKRAMGMILTGRRVSAEEGQQLGFVNAVVPVADLMAEARRWAEMILECAPLSVRASKECVLDGLGIPELEKAMSAHYPTARTLFHSDDFVEGPRAFAEKRPPKWKGC